MLIRNIVLSVDNSRNIPVPADTVINITHLLLIPGTCSARTIKSGSAIVTINPKIKLSIAIKESFLLWLRFDPTYPPIFIVDISTPILNADIPIIITIVAIIKDKNANILNGKNKRWFWISTWDKDKERYIDKSVKRSEIHTTHIENVLRANMGLPLRTHYAIDENGNGIGKPIIHPETRASIYYDAYGHTNYKRLRKDTPFIYK